MGQKKNKKNAHKSSFFEVKNYLYIEKKKKIHFTLENMKNNSYNYKCKIKKIRLKPK